jgi:hypothetical protein
VHDDDLFVAAQRPVEVEDLSLGDEAASAVIARRFKFHQACSRGKPASRPCPLAPPSHVPWTAGAPPGLVRDHRLVRSIGKTPAQSAARGCTTIGSPMSPTSGGIVVPMCTQMSKGRSMR